MVLRNIVRNALRSGHLPGTAPKVGSYVAVAVRMLTRALFRVCPFTRRAWLRCVLRLYQWLFGYINFVASECFHSSPKHVFEWGVASFVVPKVRPGARVLDVGCGRGELAWQVGQVAASVIGYDRALSAVMKAAQRGEARHVRFYCGDAEAALPIHGLFDVVILSAILPFVQDSLSFLNSLRKVSSELIVRETRYDRDFTVPLMRSLGLSHRTDPTARREYTRDSLVRELAEAGWTVKECLDTYDIYVWAVRDTVSSVTGSDRSRGRQLTRPVS